MKLAIFKLAEIVDRWEDKSKFFEIVGWYNKYQAPEIKLLETVVEAARKIKCYADTDCMCIGITEVDEALEKLDETRRG